MVVELISVGTEVLLGNIVNTNAAYLAERCAYLGLSCYYQSVVGDNAERLLGTINTALSRADMIILCGGLGPTEDDITKETAAKALSLELEMHEQSKERIQAYFDKKGLKIADSNWKQAMIPKDAIVLPNDNGTAPGVIMEKNGKTVILLPGPPNELIPMFENSVAPYIMEKSSAIIYSQVVKLCGIGESAVEDQIKDMVGNSNPTVATYAKTGEVHIRVTAKADDEKEAKKLVKPIVKELKSRFSLYVYTSNAEVSLEAATVELLEKNGLTITTAESCTGGMVASRIINVPGASEIYKEGFVTYSNKAKKLRLNVKKATLSKYGAVSEQTAKEMSKGACINTKADVSIATTGIAGPDGGSEAKPVGLVYISCTICGKTKVRECHFSGNRMKIREAATTEALTFLRMCVLEYYSEKHFA